MADPLTAFFFRVKLGEGHTFGFSKISGLQLERPTVTYQEGGLNDHVHVFPGPAKNCGTVRLERGAYAGELFPFYAVGEPLAQEMRIEIWNPADRTRLDKCYTLKGLTVKKWELGELDALQNLLLIDRFELDYETLSIAGG